MDLIEIVLSFITFLTISFLGLFIYLRNPKSWTHRLFIILTLLIDIYLGVNYLSLHPPGGPGESQLFWIRVVMSIVSLIGPVLFFLVSTFPHTKLQLKVVYIYLITFIGFTSSVVSLTPLVFSSIQYPNGEPLPIPGNGMPLFFISFIGFSAFAFVLLIYKFRKATGIEKLQLYYFLIGTILTFSLMAFSTVLLTVLFQFTGLVFLGPNSVILLVASTAYAIARHRLLDIRFIVARSVAYALLVLFIALGYVGVLFYIAYFFNRDAEPTPQVSELILPAILALFFAISFQPLRRLFEKYTDKIFYKDHYDANTLLWNLSRTMASTLYLSDLCEKIINELLTSMRINYGAVVLIRKKAIIWVGSAGHTSDRPLKGQDIFQLIHDSAKTKDHDERIFIFEEMHESKNKQAMREHDITIVQPLIVRKEVIGGLLLGQKSSGEIYSSEDIELLKILAPEVAVAVRNALSFDEIKKFNITLEQEVKHATDRLRKANTRLKELDELKDEFVSIASHELRTPMTAIKSYLWMALNQPSQEIKPQLHKYLDISYQSTERLIRLVNDMLTVSRIERNKMELNKTEFDIYPLAELVFNELKITADEKHIAFNLQKQTKENYVVKGDKDKLREVIQNLVGNALKFTPEKGKITVSFEKKKNTVHIAITDTGSGIPKESQKQLFQKFSKIEYSYAKHSSQPGTGLGLYISKQIISLHNGDIAVQSEVGVGSTFTIVLPLAKGGAEI